ncbi:MAG: CsgG/HfaB family protein [Gemmatimonadaceae bacterium]
MPISRTFGAFLAALLLGACASASRSAAPLAAQPRVAARTESATASRDRGIAHYRAGRYAQARFALDSAHRLTPRDARTALYRGLAAEQLGDIATARAAYGHYVSTSRLSPLRSRLAGRLAVLERRELAATAKAAVAQEASLAAQPGSPRTVAVLPFRFSGTDSSLRPLERGLAQLVITDLGRSRKLTVLERERVQALLAEISLSQGGRVDDATALRTGRLLRARRLVQGGISQLGRGVMRIDASVVDVATSQPGRGVAGDDRLEHLFLLEKRIVFQLFEALGVSLSAQERALVEQRPTRSIAAFVAWSAGLMAMDDGQIDDAARHFDEAVRLDPDFSDAAARSSEATAAAAGEEVSVGDLEATIAALPEDALEGEEAALEEVSSTDPVPGEESTEQSDLEKAGNSADVMAPETSAGDGASHASTEPLNETLNDAVNEVDPAPVGNTSTGDGSNAADDLGSTNGATEDPPPDGAAIPRIRFAARISELTIPIGFTVPLARRLAVDVATAYASTTIKYDFGTTRATGFTDTHLRARYTLGEDAVVLTAGLRLPTGRSAYNEADPFFTYYVSSDFLPLSSFARSHTMSATGGIALARALGAWRVGVGAGFGYSTSHEPSDPLSAPLPVQHAYRARVGVDRSIGAGQLAVGVTYSSVRMTDDLYPDAGDRVIVQGAWLFPLRAAAVTISGWNVRRLTASAGSAIASPSPSENVADVALAVGFRRHPHRAERRMARLVARRPEHWHAGVVRPALARAARRVLHLSQCVVLHRRDRSRSRNRDAPHRLARPPDASRGRVKEAGGPT